MECADKTVFTFARAMVQIKQVVLIKWCGVYSNQKNHALRFDCIAKTERGKF